MVFVTVFRCVPQPIIGTIGTIYDARFRQFEADLDWLETTGAVVEQFDPLVALNDVATPRNVQQVLAEEGARCLPLILVNGTVVSKGQFLTRAQLARVVGHRQERERSIA